MSKQTSISVIGLGPMGQAMSQALLTAGHPVTVWNRTRSRSDDAVKAGARRAADPGEAMDSGDVVILSLTDYAAMWEVLNGHEDHLRGRVLVNLSSDTPTVTRKAAQWASEHGASYLTGGNRRNHRQGVHAGGDAALHRDSSDDRSYWSRGDGSAHRRR